MPVIIGVAKEEPSKVCVVEAPRGLKNKYLLPKKMSAFTPMFTTAGEKFWLIIKNDAGDVVYQQAYKDAHFSKTIRLPKEEGEMHPTFVIRTANDQVERKFVVNRKVSEKVTVTKL